MEPTFESEGFQLYGHMALPERLRSRGTPALVLCHGFPGTAVGAAGAGRSFPDLAERIVRELGWIVFSFAYRGCGGSEGDFSTGGWLADVRAAIDHVRSTQSVSGIWLAGFGTGGSLAICAAAADPDVKGVAAFACPADFADWAAGPEALLAHAREIGAVSTDGFPRDFDAWARDLSAISATDAAPEIAPRPLLVVHGNDDGLVSSFDGRILADAHGEAELRIVGGAGHGLRNDPRAIAILLGWLSRQV